MRSYLLKLTDEEAALLDYCAAITPGHNKREILIDGLISSACSLHYRTDAPSGTSPAVFQQARDKMAAAVESRKRKHKTRARSWKQKALPLA